MSKDLHKLVWLFWPVVVFLIPYIAKAVWENAYLVMYMESGFVEVSTVLYLICAIIVSIHFIKSHDFSDHGWFKGWMILFILGCIYFAGEEMSWGQHLFGWETPEAWTEFNDQSETNLHNTSPIFDQLPRTLLSLAALIGGIIVPIYRKIKNQYPQTGTVSFWLWPTYVCVPVAFLSLMVSWNEKVFKLLELEVPGILDIRSGEVKESLLALFILMYALSLWYRNRIIKAT